MVETNPVKRENGFVENPKIAIEDLDVNAIDSLCEQFRKDVFKQANKIDPKR